MAQTVRVATVARAALPDTNAAIVVRASMKQFADAWNRADAAALAHLFTDDGDLVIPEGLLLHGRLAVQDFYASAFARGYAGSTTQADVAQLRAIAPGVMLLDATWSITGAKNTKGEPRPAERGILTAVVVKRAGRWQLAALREQEGAVAVTPFVGTPAQ
ncbi:MAG: SgcJ/EcaC family oxidoreductase [Gemmatimonadota bacterium]|nr:SgcJ/EcaC family oxidoreductase [Gemmatimonadota bacterium]